MKAAWELLAGRVVPVLFFGFFAVAAALRATSAQLLAERGGFGVVVLARELLVLFFFATVIVGYATRGPRKSGRRGPLVAVVAYGAAIAFAWCTARSYGVRTTLDHVGTAMVAAGFAWSLFAAVYARRSLSILPDARTLVTAGPYALSRHPMYLGQTIAMAGALLPRSETTFVFFVPFAIAQALRARWEDAVLASELPEWQAYAARVPRYFPFLR